MTQPATAPSQRLSAAAMLSLMLILLFAAAMRLYRMDHEGLWYDELVMARLTAGPWSDVWSETVRGRPPTYVMLGWVWTHLLGTSEPTLRLLPAIMGLASVGMMFVVGRLMFGTTVGLIAAALAAASPYQIYYSQEHRYYALMLLLTLLCLWALISGLRDGRWRWFIGLGLLGTLLFYTHLMAILPLGAMMLGALLTIRAWPRGRLWPLVGAGAIMALLTGPQLLYSMWSEVQEATQERSGASTSVEWILSTPWWAPVRTVGNFMFLGLKYIEATALVCAAVVAVLAVAVVLARRQPRPMRDLAIDVGLTRRRHYASLVIAACVFVIPIAMLFAASVLLKPMYVDRYLIGSAAGLYLLIAAGVVALRSIASPLLATTALMLAMMGSCWTYFTVPTREGWREAARFLDQQMQAGDVLIYTSERGDSYETRMVGEAIRWYLQNEPPMTPLHVTRPTDEVLSTIQQSRPASGRSWLLLWEDPDRDRHLDEILRERGEPAVTIESTHPFLAIWVYALEVKPATGRADAH